MCSNLELSYEWNLNNVNNVVGNIDLYIYIYKQNNYMAVWLQKLSRE